MKVLRFTSFTIVLALVMTAAVIPAYAAQSTTTVSFIPGVLKISDITLGSFRLVSETDGIKTYSALIGDFTVTDARGSGLGWSVLGSADGIPQGGSFVIAGTKCEAEKGANEFSSAYIDASHNVSVYPSSFISVPEGGGKGTYHFSGASLMLKIPAGSQADFGSLTITIEIVSNAF